MTTLSLRGRLCRWFARTVVRSSLAAGRTLEQRRQRLARLERFAPLPPPGTSIRHATLGGVPVEWVVHRRSQPDRMLLYLHGGAYLVGSPRLYRDLTSRLARAARLRVAALDYRLAPEHVFPAALEDAVAAYRALLEEGQSPRRLLIGGDSAGGGLALAAVMALRELGIPLPAGMVLYSPWVDLSLSGASMDEAAEREVVLSRELLADAAVRYCGGVDPRDPRVSPLFGELHGLPPMLIQAGTDELLLDDARRVAEAAGKAGVDAKLEIGTNLWHDWQVFAGKMPEADAAVIATADFFRRRTGPAPPGA
jgi:epsilon-lactone hydrolase